MRYDHSTSAGRAPKVVDHHVVALYEPVTGRIRHLHTVTVFEGGRAVAETEAIQRAQEKASNAGHDTKNLEVRVSKDADHGRRPHRIDPATKAFIAVQIKPPRRQARP